MAKCYLRTRSSSSLSLIRSMQFPRVNVFPLERGQWPLHAVEIGTTDSHLIATMRNRKPHYSLRCPIDIPNTNVRIRVVDLMFVVPNRKIRSSSVRWIKPQRLSLHSSIYVNTIHKSFRSISFSGAVVLLKRVAFDGIFSQWTWTPRDNCKKKINLFAVPAETSHL